MKISKRVRVCLLSTPALLGVWFAYPVSSTVIYNDLGTGSSVYSVTNGWGIEGAGAGRPFDQAFSFTPESTFRFTQLNVALGIEAGTNAVTVELMNDAAGSPGTALQLWNVNNLPAAYTCCTLQTLSGNGTIVLRLGSTYWVAVFPGATDTSAVWADNTIGATGPEAYNTGSGWHPTRGVVNGAFDVLGAAVPEPAAWAMMLVGIGGLGTAIRVRRRNKVLAIV